MGSTCYEAGAKHKNQVDKINKIKNNNNKGKESLNNEFSINLGIISENNNNDNNIEKNLIKRRKLSTKIVKI